MGIGNFSGGMTPCTRGSLRQCVVQTLQLIPGVWPALLVAYGIHLVFSIVWIHGVTPLVFGVRVGQAAPSPSPGMQLYPSIFAFVVFVLLFICCSIVLVAGNSRFLGERVSVWMAIRRVFAAAPALALMALAALFVSLATMSVIIPVGVLAWYSAESPEITAPYAYPLFYTYAGVVLLIAATGVNRVALLVPAAILIEGNGPITAILRSFSLMRWADTWRATVFAAALIFPVWAISLVFIRDNMAAAVTVGYIVYPPVYFLIALYTVPVWYSALHREAVLEPRHASSPEPTIG